MSISRKLRAATRTPFYQLALCFVLSGNTSAIFAADLPLSLSDAQHLAVTRSHQLTGLNNAISAAHDMAIAARQLPDPIIKFGIDNLPVNGVDRFSLGNDFMTMRRIGVMQEITRADKLKYRAAQYDISAQKTQVEKSLNFVSIQRDTALAWLERYYTEKQLTLITLQLEQSKLENQAAQSAYKGGRISQADVLTAESAVAMMEDRQIEVQARLTNAKIQLIRWVGAAGDGVLDELPDLSHAEMGSADLSEQVLHHPQINVLAKQEQLANAEASLARANTQPDWTVELNYQQRGAAYTNMVSIGFSLPLQWDHQHRQNRELSAKLALATQASSERLESERMHIAEIQNTLTEWRSKRDRLAHFQATVLPLAQQRVAANLAAYRGGKLSLNELLASQNKEIETRLQSLQLEADAAKLWAVLQYLLPNAIPDSAYSE
jgi:outer membrane protein TolC